MKYLIFLYLIFASLLITGCTSKYPSCRAGYQVIARYSNKVEKEHDWKMAGFGGSFDGVITNLTSYYDIYDKEVSIEEARRILVKGIEEFVNFINQDQKVQPFLAHYPFTYQDIDMGIGFLKASGGFAVSPHIAYAFTAKNNLIYCIHSPAEKRLHTVYREPYTEALRIVQEEGQHKENEIIVGQY